MDKKGIRKSYPSDVTDEQWKEIEPLYTGMRNCKWSKRELTNAVLYLVDSGCKWRQLPHDFPPYSTVHSFYRRARKRGLWEKILDHLVKKTRVNVGRKEEPSYGIIDSQSVKTVTYGDERGIDGGKKTKGRKRHIVVDVLGCLLSVNVHAANVHDTKSGIVVAKQAFKKYSSIKKFCADAGYRGTFVNDIKNLYSQTTK